MVHFLGTNRSKPCILTSVLLKLTALPLNDNILKKVTFKLPLIDGESQGGNPIQKLFREIFAKTTEKGSGQNIQGYRNNRNV